MHKKTMEDYIRLSASRLEANLARGRELTQELVRQYEKSSHKDITIIASGSSYNSCMAAAPFLRRMMKVHVDILSPYTYEHYGEGFQNAFSFAVSQSGCSTNIISALRHLKEADLPGIALTGNLDADIKEDADLLIEYGVGNETVDFVTMGVVTLMEFLMLFALESAARTGLLSEAEYDSWLAQMNKLPALHQQALAAAERFCRMHQKEMLSFQNVILCGGGPNYGTVLEGALKFQETLKVPAMAYEPEEFIHGPNMQLTPAYSVFLIDRFGSADYPGCPGCQGSSGSPDYPGYQGSSGSPDYPGYQSSSGSPGSRIQEIYEGVREVTDRAYLITSGSDAKDRNIICLRDTGCELLSPIYTVCVFQYITAHMTEALSCWNTHPLFSSFEDKVKCKTEDYDQIMKQKEQQDI